MWWGAYLHLLFSREIEEGYFKLGKLYRIKQHLAYNKTTGPAGTSVVTYIFFKVGQNDLFTCGMNIPATQPLLYLGVHEDWNNLFHLFLHEESQVFPIGPVNCKPSEYWEEARPGPQGV